MREGLGALFAGCIIIEELDDKGLLVVQQLPGMALDLPLQPCLLSAAPAATSTASAF